MVAATRPLAVITALVSPPAKSCILGMCLFARGDAPKRVARPNVVPHQALLVGVSTINLVVAILRLAGTNAAKCATLNHHAIIKGHASGILMVLPSMGAPIAACVILNSCANFFARTAPILVPLNVITTAN